MVHADPFADATAADDSGAGSKDYIHIRIQQRNGRKSLTTVQGLKKEFNKTKILKDFKKVSVPSLFEFGQQAQLLTFKPDVWQEFCCNGNVVEDPELGQVSYTSSANRWQSLYPRCADMYPSRVNGCAGDPAPGRSAQECVSIFGHGKIRVMPSVTRCLSSRARFCWTHGVGLLCFRLELQRRTWSRFTGFSRFGARWSVVSSVSEREIALAISRYLCRPVCLDLSFRHARLRLCCSMPTWLTYKPISWTQNEYCLYLASRTSAEAAGCFCRTAWGILRDEHIELRRDVLYCIVNGRRSLFKLSAHVVEMSGKPVWLWPAWLTPTRNLP